MEASMAVGGIDSVVAAVRKGSVSAVQVTQAAIDRLAGRGSALHAVAALAEDRAMRRARELDELPMDRRAELPLLGVPFGVKDMIETKGVPTRNGSLVPFPTRDEDAELIRRLEAAGGILVAKLAMQEFGGLHTLDARRGTDGATLNPWNAARWSGGSSSGSGAAVGAGLVPFALGAESGGSIAFPSSYCGITGLRPTFGTLPTEGVCIVCWTVDKVGPMARSAIDCETVLRVLQGGAFREARGAADGAAPLRGLRFGLAEDDIASTAWPEIRSALRDGVDALRSVGASFVETALPTDLPYREALSVIAIAEAGTVMEDTIDTPGFALFAPEQQAGLLAGRQLLARDYLDADRVRAILRDRLAETFRSVDAIVSYVTPWPAPPPDEPFRVLPDRGGNSGLIAVGNLLGLPAIFLPVGLTADGLPVGLQVVGRPYEEAALLRVGRVLQVASDWHLLTPPLATSTVAA